MNMDAYPIGDEEGILYHLGAFNNALNLIIIFT